MARTCRRPWSWPGWVGSPRPRVKPAGPSAFERDLPEVSGRRPRPATCLGGRVGRPAREVCSRPASDSRSHGDRRGCPPDGRRRLGMATVVGQPRPICDRSASDTPPAWRGASGPTNCETPCRCGPMTACRSPATSARGSRPSLFGLNSEGRLTRSRTFTASRAR